MKKPLIAIIPQLDAETGLWRTLPAYMESVTASGGVPVMIPMTGDASVLSDYVSLCDGFLFTGGQDVNPQVYGREDGGKCGPFAPLRDACESTLAKLVAETDKPVLGICRGIQILNAAFGGTLVQDLPSERPSKIHHAQQVPGDQMTHGVQLSEPLSTLLGVTEMQVNSLHHQAVDAVAPGFRVCAVATDGTVEGIYHPGKPYFRAVQWHPERTFLVDENSRVIFADFIRACREQMA